MSTFKLPLINLEQQQWPTEQQEHPVKTHDQFEVGIGTFESTKDTLPTVDENEIVENTDSIFVSIASYRDPECVNTLIDLFLKAKYPGRVFVGICQQNADEDVDCMDEVLEPFADNIRVIRISHFDAQGPMYARAIIEQSLYYGEMFYLQIDSHMLFTQDWDVICINQLAMCPSERPILTTYPNDFDRITRRHVILPNGLKQPIGSVTPTFIRFREFHDRLGFVEQEKENFHIEPQLPQPSLFWAAGFSFTLGELISQVPYDPNCPFLFVGEEMGMSMRYFTHGWDFFAPGVNIVYHLMKRTYRNTFWEQVYQKNCVVDDKTRMARKQQEAFAVTRTTDLVQGKLAFNDPYGLGQERSIRDWENFTGVSIYNKVASKRSFSGLTSSATPTETFLKQIVSNRSSVPQVLANATSKSLKSLKSTKLTRQNRKTQLTEYQHQSSAHYQQSSAHHQQSSPHQRRPANDSSLHRRKTPSFFMNDRDV